MKKWFCLLMCFLLTSCSTIMLNKANTSSTPVTLNEKPCVYTIKGEVSFFNTSIGTSTNNGYYFLEILSDGAYHTKYIDYKTCVETVLCENPNCLHKDETCSGRGENLNNVPKFVPFKENLLAVFTGSLNPVVGVESAFPRVEIMSATGSDRKLLIMLDDYITIDSTFSIDNQALYLLASKVDESSQSIFKEFLKIDIATKSIFTIYSFSEKDNIFFENIVDNKFVFKKIVTPFDKEKTPQSSEEWADMFAQQKHELFFVNQYGECETIKTWFQNELKEIIFNDEMIYFADNKIQSLNLATGIETILTNDLEQKLLGYEELIPVSFLNNHIVLHTVIVNDDGTVKYANLIVNLENSEVYESKLYIKDSANLNNPLYPIAQTDNSILIIKEIKTIQEIIEAKDGTKSKQEKMIDQYALIDIADFIKNIDNSIDVNRLS